MLRILHRRLAPLQRRASPFRPYSSSSPPPPSPPPLPRSYGPTLDAYLRPLLLRYPHISPLSLTASFLFLHELTALVPLFPIYYLFSFLGLGAGVVAYAADTQDGEEAGGARKWLRGLLAEAEKKVERMGRRYGWWGYHKETLDERKKRREKEKAVEGEQQAEQKPLELVVGGKLADVVAAYLVVKVRFVLSFTLPASHTDSNCLARAGSAAPPNPRLPPPRTDSRKCRRSMGTGVAEQGADEGKPDQRCGRETSG